LDRLSALLDRLAQQAPGSHVHHEAREAYLLAKHKHDWRNAVRLVIPGHSEEADHHCRWAREAIERGLAATATTASPSTNRRSGCG